MDNTLNPIEGNHPVINLRFLFLFLLVTLVNNYSRAQCGSLPDDCSKACNLGTLPTPPPCGPSGNTIGDTLTFNLTNIGATASPQVVSGCAYPAADVWYTFTATGTQLDLGIISALHSVNISLYQGSNCDSLEPVTCFSVAGGNLNQTFSPITPGNTYYMQISGGYIFDQAAFNLRISNDLECNNCVLNKSLTVSPPPVNGTYSPGQTVSFCFTILDYNEGPSTKGNYLHGIVLSFGNGWDSTSLTPTSIPASCAHDSEAHWGFYTRDSSTSVDTIKQKIYGPGFFYESWRGHGSNYTYTDSLPGDNDGDGGVEGTTCQPTFCWKITTKSNMPCPNDASLKMSVKTTGDSQSGDWSNPGCEGDPVSTLNAVLSCCSPPTVKVYNTACNKNNGRALATGSGYAPWHYVWLNDAGTVIANDSLVYGPDSISNLAIGQYFVTVFDSTNCSNLGIASIGVQPKDSFSINVKPVCHGFTSDGSIVLTNFTPENGPYLYQLNNGVFQNSNVLTNLTARQDTVVSLSSYGCLDTFKANITTDAAINIMLDTVYPVTCAVGGEIVVTVTGGTPNYNYSWGDTFSGNPVYNLPQGTYTLTVTDGANAGGYCTDTATYTVTVGPNAINFGTGIITPPSCNGSHDASITAQATGRGQVKFHWFNNDTTATISNLAAGFYTVTATDTAGCVATYTYRVQNPKFVVIDMVNIVPQSCSQGGVIHVIASGGTGSLTYIWSNSSLSGDSVDGLIAGQYNVTVHDANSCSTSASYTVNSVIYSLSFTEPDITDPVCFGYSTGSIAALATNNVGKIRYRWSNGDTTAAIINIPAGTYTVIATDSNLCADTISYIVTQPSEIAPNLSYKLAICFFDSTDTITAHPTGGTPGYTYQWSNNSSTVSNIVEAGVTYLTVTDSKNCAVIDTVNIIHESPNVYSKPAILQSVCQVPAYGTWITDIYGGFPPYTVEISGLDTNVTEFADTLYNIPSGVYMVYITDSVGCTYSQPSFVIQNSIANDSFKILSYPTNCYGLSTGTIVVVPLNPGDGPFSYQLNNGAAQTSDTFSNVFAGDYNIEVTSISYGCHYSLDTSVSQPAPHLVTITPDSAIGSPGKMDTLSVSTDFTNPIYEWSPLTGIGCPTCDTTSVLIDSSVNGSYYYVKVYSTGDPACNVSDSVLIISAYPQLIDSTMPMPTAFTPNGDNHDDVFGPPFKPGSFNAPTIKAFKIYNRFGELVHNSASYWDGTFDGKDQPVGTYVYYIEVEIDNPGEAPVTHKYEGSVTLLR